jgi:ATP-dependent Clp protease protease subunit
MTPQLLKLLAKNKGKGYFKAESTADTAVIYLYDAIVSDNYWGGVSALDFVKELSAITAPNIELRINSPGGDVFAARAMAQAMKEHPSQITAHVDGYAASAATFLVIAADSSVISDGAMFMIHNAWTIAAGNAKDFADMSALLSRTDQTIVTDYMAKTGATEDQVKAWMAAETYFYGQEAVDAGFITALATTAPKNEIDWDLSAYAKAPPPEPDTLQQNQNRLRIMQALMPH